MEIISPVCPISLLVDYEVVPPICAFEVTNNTPEYTKTGIIAWLSDVTIYYVHTNEQKATEEILKIEQALATFSRRDVSVTLVNKAESFDKQMYAWKLDLQIKECF